MPPKDENTTIISPDIQSGGSEQPPAAGDQPPAQPSNVSGGVPGGDITPKNRKLPMILLSVFLGIALVTAIGLGIYSVNLNNLVVQYRDQYEQLLDSEVAKALDDQRAELEEDFAEREKKPNKEYISPPSSASVKIVYPKTWDLYTEEDLSKGTVESHFNVNYVPDKSDRENTFSLRMEVVDRAYASIAKSFESEAKRGVATIKPYKNPNVENSEVGIRVDGEVRSNVIGSLVAFPVRDKTIQVWTESDRFVKDFDNIVLKNLTYSP